jgi:serine/threonine protein phosphatase PrpC
MQCPATQVLLASGEAFFLVFDGLGGARGGMVGWASVINADTCGYPEPHLLV